MGKATQFFWKAESWEQRGAPTKEEHGSSREHLPRESRGKACEEVNHCLRVHTSLAQCKYSPVSNSFGSGLAFTPVQRRDLALSYDGEYVVSRMDQNPYCALHIDTRDIL